MKEPLLPRRTIGELHWLVGVLTGSVFTGGVWLASTGSPWSVAAGGAYIALMWTYRRMLPPEEKNPPAPGEPGTGKLRFQWKGDAEGCQVCGRPWAEHDFGVPHPSCPCPPLPGRGWGIIRKP